MKYILILLAIITGTAFANESVKENPTSQFPYVSLGIGPAPVPLPVFGVGYRAQWGHHGVNALVNASTVYYITGVKGSVLYNYYFKPNLDSQFYFGVGPAVGGLFSNKRAHGYGGAAEFSFGKQYRNQTGDVRFFEAEFDFPLVVDHKPHFVAYPVVVLNYGIGF